MATNDEKRRVAAELRESIPDGNFSKGEKGWGVLYLTLFGHYMPNQRSAMTYREVASRLADLIEPPRQCPHYHSDRHYCSVHEDVRQIDRDALLALEDEMFEDATGLALISQLEKNEELQDLQSTMAKALMDYARRIREALGVDDGR